MLVLTKRYTTLVVGFLAVNVLYGGGYIPTFSIGRHGFCGGFSRFQLQVLF